MQIDFNGAKAIQCLKDSPFNKYLWNPHYQTDIFPGAGNSAVNKEKVSVSNNLYFTG